MYQIDDLIIYGSYGVCKVEAIGKIEMSGVDADRDYYTLCPLYQNGKIFTPVDTNIFMRPVISNAEVKRLIAIIPSINEDVYINRNLRLLEVHYKESLQTHDCIDLIKLIKAVYRKKVVTVGQGKKLSIIDERFMKRAEDLLYGELAVVLCIPKENVEGYVEDRLKEL